MKKIIQHYRSTYIFCFRIFTDLNEIVQLNLNHLIYKKKYPTIPNGILKQSKTNIMSPINMVYSDFKFTRIMK